MSELNPLAKLLQLLRSGVKDGRIALTDAEEIIKSNEYDLEANSGYTSLADLIEDLEDLSLEDDVIVFIDEVSDTLPNVVPEKIAIETELPAEEIAVSNPAVTEETVPEIMTPVAEEIIPDESILRPINVRICTFIYEGSTSVDSKTIHLSKVGDFLRQNEIVLPEGAKLKKFLGWSPKLYTLDEYYVTLTKIGCYLANSALKRKAEVEASVSKPAEPKESKESPSEPVAKEPAKKAELKEEVAPAQPEQMSVYRMNSFFVIPSMKDFCEELEKLAEPDGWFIVREPAEKDPYRLMRMKLQLDFAIAMKKLVENDGVETPDSDFKTWMLRATYRTGFHTADGKPIFMEMDYNPERGATGMAHYRFKRFFTVD